MGGTSVAVGAVVEVGVGGGEVAVGDGGGVSVGDAATTSVGVTGADAGGASDAHAIATYDRIRTPNTTKQKLVDGLDLKFMTPPLDRPIIAPAYPQPNPSRH